MSVRILWDGGDNVACLYDSVTGIVFGEVFTGDDSYEDAERFLNWLTTWLGRDPRALPPGELAQLRKSFFDEKPVAA